MKGKALYTLNHMTLQEQIKEQMKDAMRAKETTKVMTLRGLMSAFTNELVATGKMPTDLLSDDQALAVITREAKRRKDSIAQFEEAGRGELAADEKEELAILEAFLPEMMSADEVRSIVIAKKEALGIVDASEKGKLIGALMADLKGKADGAMVQTIVSELLS